MQDYLLRFYDQGDNERDSRTIGSTRSEHAAMAARSVARILKSSRFEVWELGQRIHDERLADAEGAGVL